LTSYLTPIRWRDDTGWEYRCGDCAAKAIDCFWPLTDEFWDRKRTMRRCRSCQKNRDARRSRELYRKSPQYRENQRRAAKRYAEETVDARRIYERQRWQDVKEMDEEDRALVRQPLVSEPIGLGSEPPQGCRRPSKWSSRPNSSSAAPESASGCEPSGQPRRPHERPGALLPRLLGGPVRPEVRRDP
jgi:hypothetical protein